MLLVAIGILDSAIRHPWSQRDYVGILDLRMRVSDTSSDKALPLAVSRNEIEQSVISYRKYQMRYF